MKTKIEWCDWTWNPVWGCENKCPYCYARKINERFHVINDFSSPEWMANNFNKPFPKKPSRIFVNSMSDISWWKPAWMGDVIDKISKHPEHLFLFLTKTPAVYLQYVFPENCMLGVTITNQAQMDALASLKSVSGKMFLSIEPLLGYVSIDFKTDWVIIGAMTGTGAKPIEYEWADNIINQCIIDGIPVFTKNSLEKYGIPIIQQFPTVSNT